MNGWVRGDEQVSVERQGLCQVVLPGMIVLPNTMEMGIRSLRETREHGNGRGNCAEPTHRKPFYRSGTGQPNHFEVPPRSHSPKREMGVRFDPVGSWLDPFR